MKSNNFFSSILTVLLALPLFNACCSTTADCDESGGSAYIRLLSKVDSTDLFFGQDPKYQVEQTKFFGLSNGDTIHLPHTALAYLLDTVVHVDFGYDIDTSYVQFEDGDIDTFTIFRRTTESECCGTTIQLDEITFNDTIRMENTFPYFVLLK